MEFTIKYLLFIIIFIYNIFNIIFKIEIINIYFQVFRNVIKITELLYYKFILKIF